MSDEIKIRWAEARDVVAMVRVINVAFRAAESFFIERDRIDAETLQAMLDRGNFLLAEEAAGLAGLLVAAAGEEELEVVVDGLHPGVQLVVHVAGEEADVPAERHDRAAHEQAGEGVKKCYAAAVGTARTMRRLLKWFPSLSPPYREATAVSFA